MCEFATTKMRDVSAAADRINTELGLDRDAVTAERFRCRADYVEPEKLPGRAADYFEELYKEINAPLRWTRLTCLRSPCWP